MAEVNIPDGYGIPLADLETGLLPDRTVEAFDDRYASDADITELSDQVEQLSTDLGEVDEAVDNLSGEVAELPERFAPRTGTTRRSNGFVVMGDSISAYGGGTYAYAWQHQLAQLSGQTMRLRASFAEGGYTLDQMEQQFLPLVLAMDPKPQICIIQGGTNHQGNEAENLATHARIREALEDAAITPGIFLLCPRSETTAARDANTRWNAIMQGIAADKGYPLIDGYTPLVNPETGAWKAGTNLNNDHVHPTRYGHTLIGQYVAQDPRATSFFVDSSPFLITSNVDTSNLSQNALAIGDSNSDGLANQWTTYGTITKSLHPADFGNFQRVTLPASTNPGGGIRNVSLAITPGNVYEFSARAHVDLDVDRPDVRYVASISWRNGGAAISTDRFIDLGGVEDAYAVGYRRLTAPATSTVVWIDITFNMNSTQTTREVFGEIGQITIRNLTALGLA